MTTYIINESNGKYLCHIMPSKNARAATELTNIPRPMQCPGHLKKKYISQKWETSPAIWDPRQKDRGSHSSLWS